jgi:hypothetical protein
VRHDLTLVVDAVLAERVLGYVWRKSRSTGRRCIYAASRCPDWMDSPAVGTEPLVGDWGCGGWTPAFHRDNGAALTLVEALGGHVTLARVSDGWLATVCHETAWGETLPLAICHAALVATQPPRERTEPRTSEAL